MMHENIQTSHVVFFDIGDTLGKVTATDQTLTLQVFPGVKHIVSELNKRHVHLGVVSKIGDFTPVMVDQMLKDCDLFHFFDARLLHYISGNTPKDKSEFEKAIGKSAINAASTIFIGENPQERSQAAAAGMRVGALPADALDMLKQVI